MKFHKNKTLMKISECTVKLIYVFVGDSVCLACYVANGHIMVYSLPSLKLLLDVEFLALTDLRYYMSRKTSVKLCEYFNIH